MGQENTNTRVSRPNPLLLIGIGAFAILAIVLVVIFALPKNNNTSTQTGGLSTDQLLPVLENVRKNSKNFEDIISGGFRGQLTLSDIYDDADYAEIVQNSVEPLTNLYKVTQGQTAVQGHVELSEVITGLNEALSTRLPLYENFTSLYDQIAVIWNLEEDAERNLVTLKSSSNTNLRALGNSLQDYYDLTSPVMASLDKAKCDYDEIKSRLALTPKANETMETFLARRRQGISATCQNLASQMDQAKSQFEDDGTLVTKMLYASGEYVDVNKETIYGYVNALENALGVDYESETE